MQEVNVEMPTVSICCPYCGKEDDHSNRIWNNCEGYALATGKTYCDHCEKWFDVNLIL